MKIILSRKGLDSEVCDINNLLLTDKENKKNLIMLPIPENDSKHIYRNLKFSDNKEVFNIVKEYLNKSKKINIESKCHADPNLINYFNDPIFLGSIGQVDQAQGYLQNQKVNIGDLFVFFGAFSDVSIDEKNELHVNKNNARHIMFGYLQIGDIIHTYNLTKQERKNYESKYPWLANQPHWTENFYLDNKTNCIYVASEKFKDTDLVGFGTFEFNNELVLTKENQNCLTHWNLPKELKNLNISYHTQNSYKDDYFQSACRGQEFVIENSVQVENWAENLIKKYVRR